jgi:PhnB protein
MPAKPIPSGYHSITPHLIVHDAAGAIEFYQQAFGATELLRLSDGSGKVGHAELQIGDSRIMLADEHRDLGYLSPKSLGGVAASLLLYVSDVDAVLRQAEQASVTVVHPLADQFYGDRTVTVADPFGHQWTIATHQEDVSPEEVQRRFRAATGPGASV